MPVLFAATLFLSASLLFMVQPMVAKMVLPLLGGSPAVWNACMVFFQALLLLGYLYSHHLSGKFSPRKQWLIHLLVLGLPLASFFLAVAFGARHSPIAIVESLAPGEGSSPVLRVLLLLSMAIGVPFLVVSTSAPLLQKWFTCTGHPSSRDPYFLYAASNFGSMISLLGYPLFIEPNLSIVGQAWVFAIGFAVLAGLIAACGYAAAHPIAVPPVNLQAGKGYVKQGQGQKLVLVLPAPSPDDEAAPSLARKLKWVTLAFVPSSMMLGVTFYMTTDIASIPLLWVGPLALYLITFIIAFGRVPEWFRLVIGNLAPVMILLLVFVRLSRDIIGFTVAIELLLLLTTFFAAALMCHYELARDRPSPKYLTGFFLLMSVGGVLGGVFNSLVAPVVFPYAYEFPLILVAACLMVPMLTEEESADARLAADKIRPDVGKLKQVLDSGSPAEKLSPEASKLKQVLEAPPPRPPAQSGANEARRRRALALDFVVPACVGVGYYLLLRGSSTGTFAGMCHALQDSIGIKLPTIQVMLINAPIVMLCFFFVDRPLRFALCVAAILGYFTYMETGGKSELYSTRSFFGILYVERNVSYQRPTFTRKGQNGEEEEVVSGRIVFSSLRHGTTLHGKQISWMENNVFDMFQALTALNPLENFVIAEANHRFNAQEEPLTYYHRSGPVGAMFHELRTRKGGADAAAPVAMVGLGTGSASAYALPGQHLTFYEIDRAVLKIVEKPWKVMNEEEMKKDPSIKEVMGPFTYVDDARNRGAEVEIRIGDARLRLKDDTDRKYALLLVDAFSSDSIPIHLLTKEAVQLYFDRMTPDGILALHISNKYVRLEPVVAAIARDLGVAARVWNDDEDDRPRDGAPRDRPARGGPGKTASSWVALARTPEQLGSLYSPMGDLIFSPSTPPGVDDRMNLSLDRQLIMGLREDYEAELTAGRPESKYQQMNKAEHPKEEWLKWVREKLGKATDPNEKARLQLYEQMIAEHGETQTFQDIMLKMHSHAFRRLETYTEVHAWTDDYSDVMRVMMLPELQAIRKFFGLPTPIER